MRIDKVEVFQICMPFKVPFAFGQTVQEYRDHVVVALSSGDRTGWGEGALLRWPFYNAETTAGAYHLVCDLLAPQILGKEIASPSDLQNLFALVLGNKMALAAVDFAWWDLYAQCSGVSLAKALGVTRQEVTVGISLGKRATENEFFSAIEASLRTGYPRIKCKVSPGYPLQWLTQLRAQCPHLIMSVDANGSFSRESFDELREYEALGLAMIEQPFHPKELLLSAELQRCMQTDICLDESVEDLHDLELVAALGAGRVVNIKPARVGGLTSSIAIRERCAVLGLKSWVGGLMETGIGRATNLAFAATIGDEFPHDIDECGRYCSEELITEIFELAPKGKLRVPSEIPGLGVTVNREELARYTVAQRVVA
ncbi:MAG: o-succinylbenzoate synthase [Proteobacteria bacterium]|nr:o-succinylbenzoate synthase [Pseudomonadota bacterium]